MENSARMTNHVTSKDGTPIAYARQGSGPAVILVGRSSAHPTNAYSSKCLEV